MFILSMLKEAMWVDEDLDEPMLLAPLTPNPNNL